MLLRAVSVVQTLKPEDYHVTVVSPETYYAFTPLLPCEFSREVRMFLRLMSYFSRGRRDNHGKLTGRASPEDLG